MGSLGIAQNPSQIDVLTTEQGLLFRDVKSIVQDAAGLMYFGTSQGINRYDGYRFKIYNSSKKENTHFIPEESITGALLLQKEEQILWYMALDELYQLDLVTNNVISFDHAKGIKGKVLRLIKTTDGNLWAITDDYWENQDGNATQYLQKYVNGTFKEVATVNRNNRGFSRFVEDKKGFLWWSTPNGTLKFDHQGKLMNTYVLADYDWYDTNMNFVVSFFDSDNTHYYFPYHGGINTFNDINQSSTEIFQTDISFDHAIEDYRKFIWFSSQGSLYRKSPDGTFLDYTQVLKSKLDFTIINSLFIDASNLLWIATNNGLIKIRLKKEVFDTIFTTDSNGWGNTTRGIFEDADGILYAMCESSEALFLQRKPGVMDTLQLKSENGQMEQLNHASTFFVLDDVKTSVYTTGKSLLKIDLKSGRVKDYSEFTSINSAYKNTPLLKLRDGKLLFGNSLSRLMLFDPVTDKSNLVVELNNDYDNIFNFKYFLQSKQKDIIWIGTEDNGLLKFNSNGTIERMYDVNSNPQLSKNHVLVLEEDLDGSLWIGTYGGGLNHLSSDGKTIREYTNASGLPDNNVVGILTDTDNNLWLSTYNGLSFFDKETEVFRNFYEEDGLSHNEFNYSSFLKTEGGDFYFGGMNGINKFRPEHITRNFESPHLYISHVSKYNNRSNKTVETDYSQSNFTEVILSPYDQYFEIGWSMPSYFQNQKNTYSTKLEGFEDRWFYQGNTPSVRYNQLPAGNYVLKIKGKDARGNDSATILSIPIVVKQIFYKKWWFIALVLALIITMMYAIFKYRFKQALAIERLRTRISSDLHDDVGSLLSGLAMQTELMEINASEADKSKLEKIAGMSRSAISQMRDLVWSIDSRRETTNDLIERVQELAEELLLPREISFQFTHDNVKYPNRKLAAQVKHNIFLIYKEAITNILRHSDADHVVITMSNRANGCTFSVEDNGSKKENYKSTGLGLSNMQMRAKAIKADLSFEMENGFTVCLKLPFDL